MSPETAKEITGERPLADGEMPIARIDATLAVMRRMVGRRAIGRVVVEKVGLQLSQLDLIEAVRRLEEEEEAGEATVGAIGERLAIDPSRASRVVAQGVEAGLLRRDVSQADARRAVVRLTDHSQDLMVKLRKGKRELIEAALSDWSPADIEVFSKLFERFYRDLEQEADRSAPATTR